MHRVRRTSLVALIALMGLALVGNPLVGSAQAAPLPQQQEMQQNGGNAAVPDGSIPVWGEANWQLAARFAPYEMRDLVYSTSVQPRWIEGTDNFWYRYETSDGARFMLVDPAAGTKRPIFDNDRIAAELTRITKDPYDGKHLPITSIRFIDPDTIQFDVTSSQDAPPDEMEQDMQEEEEQEQQRGRQRTEKLVHHFEFTVSTQTLRELDDYEEPDDHPGWASVSPAMDWVVFGKDYNLYMMSYEDYQRILDARRGKDGDEAEEA
ncbi:MAG: S9 family peptidase, partial [Acidobacteriota bacterium]